jgi:TRAP-type uncharacterized transport system fused permease subunit
MRGFNHQLSNLRGNCEILEAMISFFFVFVFVLFFSFLMKSPFKYYNIFRVYSNLNKSLNETKKRQ